MSWSVDSDWSRLGAAMAILKGLKKGSLIALSAAVAAGAPSDVQKPPPAAIVAPAAHADESGAGGASALTDREIETVLTMTGRALEAKSRRMEAMQAKMEGLQKEVEEMQREMHATRREMEGLQREVEGMREEMGSKDAELRSQREKLAKGERDARAAAMAAEAKAEEAEAARRMRAIAEDGMDALGAALEKAREDLTKEKMTHQLAGNQLLKSRSMEWQALEALEEETRVRQAMEAAILVLDKWLHQCLVQLAARGSCSFVLADLSP
eukprot:jgi/Mesen1/4057/ME000213S03083